MSDTPRADARLERNGNVLCSGANLDLCRQLERELGAAQIGAARYEYLRKLHPSDYSKLYNDCLFQDLNFDAEVDRRRLAT